MHQQFWFVLVSLITHWRSWHRVLPQCQLRRLQRRTWLSKCVITYCVTINLLLFYGFHSASTEKNTFLILDKHAILCAGRLNLLISIDLLIWKSKDNFNVYHVTDHQNNTQHFIMFNTHQVLNYNQRIHHDKLTTDFEPQPPMWEGNVKKSHWMKLFWNSLLPWHFTFEESHEKCIYISLEFAFIAILV